MSEENVEFVRNVFAMIDRGDAEAWDLLPADFVIDLSRRLIDPVVLHGPDEMRAFYRNLDATWAGGARLEVEELIEAGDKVLMLIRFSGRGKTSGAQVEALVWNLWTFRDGEPVGWTYFGEERADAFEAAGLSE
ncbi:MAG: nuclear transport factor 2 family protein [Solirubrobacterales bacterium]